MSTSHEEKGGRVEDGCKALRDMRSIIMDIIASEAFCSQKKVHASASRGCFLVQSASARSFRSHDPRISGVPAIARWCDKVKSDCHVCNVTFLASVSQHRRRFLACTSRLVILCSRSVVIDVFTVNDTLKAACKSHHLLGQLFVGCICQIRQFTGYKQYFAKHHITDGPHQTFGLHLALVGSRK